MCLVSHEGPLSVDRPESGAKFDFLLKMNTLYYILVHNHKSMATMATTTFTTRLDTEVKADLEAIARYEDRSASYLANQAITALVEERKATHELIGVGLKLIDKGVSISEEVMDAWFDGPEDAPFPAPDAFER